MRPRAAAGLAVLLAGLGAGAAAGQTIGGVLPGPLPLFPADNWWNVDVTAAPVDANSAAFITWIGVAKGMHPDFGGNAGPTAIYGMPYVTVPGTEPLEPMAFDYASESDAGAPGRPAGYPIPVEAKTQPHWIEGGYPGNCDSSYAGSPCRGDKHVLVVDVDHRLLFETWNTRCLPAGSPTCTWRAGSGAVFSLDSNARRPDGWTSADAAGLAILPGLVRYDEAYGTQPIRHAFRFTVRDTNGYVYPASHVAGSNPSAPPMGTRLRLKASKDISGFAAPVQRIFQAMKTYGLIVADNGTDMYVQGTYDTRWDNGILNPAFASLTAGDFDVIQLGWVPPAPPVATTYHALAPCRLVDTRVSGPAFGKIAAGTQKSYVLTGACGVPPSAVSLSANVAVVAPAATGDVVVFPGGTGAPGASTVSFAAGRTRANNAQILLSSDGTGRATVRNNSGGSLDFLVDVTGYYQ